jgi:hypothetical protein
LGKSGTLHVRIAHKATGLLRRREMSQCATNDHRSLHEGFDRTYFDDTHMPAEKHSSIISRLCYRLRRIAVDFQNHTE